MSNRSAHAASGSYYLATATAQQSRPVLEHRENAHICIIGAGYTGLSCALHLAQSGQKVIVLEAEHAGFGASGRNGGQVIPGQRIDQIELERRYGSDTARKLADLATEAQTLVRTLIAAHCIDCGVKSGHLTAAVRDRHARDLKNYVEHIERCYNYSSARYVPRDEMPELVGTGIYRGGLFDTDGMHLHPLNYALGLARAAEAAGAVIYHGSRVTSVDGKGPAIVSTEKGAVTADFVVYACNGYLEGLNGRLAASIMPISNYVAATAPLTPSEAKALIPSDAAVSDTKFVLDYYRLSTDNRLIFGGGETYGAKDAGDAERLVRPCIERVFPHLKGIAIDYAWGGRLAITTPRLPHIGRLTPSIYFAQGYSGQGVAIATLCGKLMAEAISGQSSRFDVMASLNIPRLPGGTLLRQPLLQLALTWYALRDRLG
jgi:gamma-glutamylputrescine oxidase